MGELGVGVSNQRPLAITGKTHEREEDWLLLVCSPPTTPDLRTASVTLSPILHPHRLQVEFGLQPRSWGSPLALFLLGDDLFSP